MSAALRDDPEAVDLAVEQIALEAADARESPHRFFEFVMLSEDTQEPLVLAPHQELFFDFMLAHRKAVAQLPIDHSKCHGRGTPILMADGSERVVEDVRVGDRVMGPSGPMRVRLASTGRGQLFKVVPKKGRPFVVNEDHILTLVESGTDRVVDVVLRDYLAWPRSRQDTHKLFRVPVLKFDGEQEPEIDPYFLGVWFGDGLHSTKRVVVTNVDDEVRLACLEIASSYGLAVVPNDEQSFYISKQGGMGAGRGGNPLLDALRRVVGPELSMEKVRTAPWAYRAAFLAGFIDSDGSTRENTVHVSQKRADWSRDVAFIARSLGIGVTEATFENPIHGTYHLLTLYGTRLADVPIRVERKKVRARTDARGRSPKDSLRTGFFVEVLSEGDYYGFTIGGDGRYLLGDFIVTHNTFGVAALVLYMLGKNPRLRGGYVSAAEDQAKKPLDLVKRYIEQSPQLRLVFPKLRRSPMISDDWNEGAIVVDRPYGIRDASLKAFGLDSKKITGSRWDYAVIDDSLNDENVATPEQRDKVDRRLQKDVESRVDPRKGIVWYVNTARHLEDAVQKKTEKWPTLIMRVDGTIQIKNAPHFDSPHIRPADDLPSDNPNATYRLVAHDPDPDNAIPLWPERWPVEAIEERRRDWLPEVFAQNLMNYPISDAASLCKQAYLDAGILVAQKLGITGFAADRTDIRVKDIRGGGDFGPMEVLIFAGVDLAVAKGSKADESSIFVFAVFPRGIRVPLWIEAGKWGAKEIEQRVFAVIERFRPAGIAVESNAAQELFRQMLAERQDELVKKELRTPIKPFTTDAKKHNPFFGVPSLFTEMANGLWAIPNDRGMVRPEVRKWMNQCLQYSPSDHTGDVLMGQYFASELAKKFGAIARARTPGESKRGPGIAANLRAR